jgi:hypothetical protein
MIKILIKKFTFSSDDGFKLCTFSSIIILLIFQFLFVSWDSKKDHHYVNEKIIGEWDSFDEGFKVLNFNPNGIVRINRNENLNLPFKKVNDRDYIIYTFRSKAIKRVELINNKTIKVFSLIKPSKDPVIYYKDQSKIDQL